MLNSSTISFSVIVYFNLRLSALKLPFSYFFVSYYSKLSVMFFIPLTKHSIL